MKSSIMSSWGFIELVSSCYSWRCRAVFKLYYLVVAASQAYDSPHLVLRTRQPFLQSTMLALFFVTFWDKALSWFASSAPWFMQVWLSSPSLYLWRQHPISLHCWTCHDNLTGCSSLDFSLYFALVCWRFRSGVCSCSFLMWNWLI